VNAKRDLNKLTEDRQMVERTLDNRIAQLEALSATKEALERTQRTSQQVTSELQKTLSTTAAIVQENQNDLKYLDGFCKSSLATKEHAYEVAERCARKMAAEIDD